jgi:hypothetical protein
MLQLKAKAPALQLPARMLQLEGRSTRSSQGKNNLSTGLKSTGSSLKIAEDTILV